jgi:hypothetical protein
MAIPKPTLRAPIRRFLSLENNPPIEAINMPRIIIPNTEPPSIEHSAYEELTFLHRHRRPLFLGNVPVVA